MVPFIYKLGSFLVHYLEDDGFCGLSLNVNGLSNLSKIHSGQLTMGQLISSVLALDGV